jgi:uncharacterized OB-fold protein
VERIVKRRTFVQDGKTYTHTNDPMDPGGGPVKRFPYGQEPEVLALIPLEGGGTVEVAGTASHWNQTTVSVGWHDDNRNWFDCVVPAKDVQRLEKESNEAG